MTLVSQISSILDSLKAQNITIIDVREQSDEFDTIVIASGTSSRHNQALMQNCLEHMKKNYSIIPQHTEQDSQCQWILMDYDSVIVHLLQDETRQYYDLERLWAPMPQTLQEVN